MRILFKKIENYIKWKFRGDVATEILIKQGLKVGKNFKRQNECIIDYSHCWLITIGNNVTLAPRVHILAHDASTKESLGYSKIGLVNIGDNVFVGANSVILPNVKIGNDVIIGAGSIVTKDISSGYIAIGNPAKILCKTSEYLNKNKLLMEKSPVYDEKWTLRRSITTEQKKQMCIDLKDRLGYVE